VSFCLFCSADGLRLSGNAEALSIVSTCVSNVSTARASVLCAAVQFVGSWRAGLRAMRVCVQAAIRGTVFMGYVIAQGSMMLSVRRPGTSLGGPPSSLGVLTSQAPVVPSPIHPMRCCRCV
jgi:hypothetical protein